MSLVETDMTADYEIELYSHSDTDDASDDLFIENEGADEVLLFDAGIEEDEELDVHYVGPQRSQCETLHRFDEDFDADVQDESTGSEAHSDAEIDERGQSIERLESLVLSLLSQLVASLPSDIDSQAKCSKGKKIVLQVADRRKSSIDGATATREIKFPQRSRGPSIKPIAQLFKVVNLMHEALVNNVPTTKRDMYYKDVELFKSQSVVDRLVDDVAASLNLGRADLGVRASSKGLIAGSGLIIHLEEGGTIDINDNESSLIPPAEEISRFEVTDDLSWVLIVEKEAVFQTLCRLKFANNPSLPGLGIIITGKGYPDVATRQLVKTLSDNLPPHIPLLALVDGDAYGLDILSVYKYGSMSMQHENERLAAESVQWLGIMTSELATLGISKDALLPITKHDEKKALSMLRRTNLPRHWRKELQYMLHNRRKAEIEIITDGSLKASGDNHHDDSEAVHTPGSKLPSLRSYQEPMLARYLLGKISLRIVK